ncbi:MAG: tripartite tricarboxylate transporter substrate binding protein [Rhizobiales bacterium]|nr:tripartite tricarboxylate transporter substrate binding protein [Hyphomicrobiales bacterium]
MTMRPDARGMSRRQMLVGSSLLASGIVGGPASALNGASLRIVVPFSAGTIIDAMARRLAESMQAPLGALPIVLNREGASGTLAFDELARREADAASVIFSAASQLTIHPHLMREPQLRVADFFPICQIFEQPFVLVASRAGGMVDVPALIAQGRARPGELKFGHYGLASSTHLQLLGFAQAAGLAVIAVPYRAHGQLIADVASGALDGAITSVASFDTAVIRPLALVTSSPSAVYPGLPTLQSLGYPSPVTVFGGFFARAGLPDEHRHELELACRRGFDAPDFQVTARRMGVEPIHADSAAFASRINEESLRMQALLMRFGLASQ